MVDIVFMVPPPKLLLNGGSCIYGATSLTPNTNTEACNLGSTEQKFKLAFRTVKIGQVLASTALVFDNLLTCNTGSTLNES